MSRHKGHALCLMLVGAMLFAACEDKKSVRHYLDAGLALYREKPDDIAAVAALYSDGLAAHPDDMALLQSRAGLYCNHGMLPECRADTQRLTQLKPDHAEARMMLCMLNEYEGASPADCAPCYREALKLFAARLQSATPEWENAHKFSYIFALSMAGAPDAEKERAAFLESMKDEPLAWLHEAMLADFDRRQILEGIFRRP